DQPLVDVVGGLEPVDLAGEAHGVLRGVEARDRPDPRTALDRGLPPVRGVQARGRDDADAGERDTPVPIRLGDGQVPASISSCGRAKIMADWKPPKPLAVESAASTRRSRATFGV